MSRHSSRTVFVGNLPGDIREREVEALFIKYGHITRIDLKVPPRPPRYAFVVFEDAQDAEVAICGRDGYDFDGRRLRVEAAHGGCGNSSSRDQYSIHSNGQGGRGVTRLSEYRVLVNRLPSSASCQDLKDHMRKAGDVCFSQVFHDGRGTSGIVDYTNYDDMKYAIKKLDDSEFRNAFSKSCVRVREYDLRRDSRSPGCGPSHSRGRRYSRSRRCSRSRSHSPGHSQSKFSKGKSSQRSPAKSPERSVSRSHSRSRFRSLSGSGSRSRCRSPLPMCNKSPKKHSASRSPSRSRSRSKSLSRGDNLIMDAISSLNELDGSNETTIADFIENHYKVQADFKKFLSAKLKSLTSSGKLIKMKPRYKIPTSMKFDKDEIHSPTQSEMDLKIKKIMSMSAQEAATYTAQAVAEAEAFLEEDEEATKEAEAAEAYADAAEAFVEAARKKLKGRNNPKDDDPCY